jgi:hypothetical protein
VILLAVCKVGSEPDPADREIPGAYETLTVCGCCIVRPSPVPTTAKLAVPTGADWSAVRISVLEPVREEERATGLLLQVPVIPVGRVGILR